MLAHFPDFQVNKCEESSWLDVKIFLPFLGFEKQFIRSGVHGIQGNVQFSARRNLATLHLGLAALLVEQLKVKIHVVFDLDKNTFQNCKTDVTQRIKRALSLLKRAAKNNERRTHEYQCLLEKTRSHDPVAIQLGKHRLLCTEKGIAQTNFARYRKAKRKFFLSQQSAPARWTWRWRCCSRTTPRSRRSSATCRRGRRGGWCWRRASPPWRCAAAASRRTPPSAGEAKVSTEAFFSKRNLQLTHLFQNLFIGLLSIAQQPWAFFCWQKFRVTLVPKHSATVMLGGVSVG